MESNKSFIIKLLYLTALIFVLSLAWKFFAPVEWITPTVLVLPFFFLGVTLVIHSYLSKTYQQKFQKFLNRYLIVTTVKLIGLLVLMAVYIYRFPEDGINFVLTLFVNYLVFTMYEARALILHGRK
ncbi:MAG: hypothetical protein JXR34_06785 [Bacteroidales bacterium]|nr:hypothetical protein [Bacteroidales bacterium]